MSIQSLYLFGAISSSALASTSVWPPNDHKTVSIVIQLYLAFTSVCLLTDNKNALIIILSLSMFGFPYLDGWFTTGTAPTH